MPALIWDDEPTLVQGTPPLEVRVDVERGVRILEVHACVLCGEPVTEDDCVAAAVARLLGPTCWDCWLRLPTHVHLWALDAENRGGEA